MSGQPRMATDVNPFTALPRAVLGVNTASYMPEPQASLYAFC